MFGRRQLVTRASKLYSICCHCMLTVSVINVALILHRIQVVRRSKISSLWSYVILTVTICDRNTAHFICFWTHINVACNI